MPIEQPTTGDRRALLRWSARFFLASTLLLQAVALRYLAEYTWPDEPLAVCYAVAAFVGQLALLGMLPWLVTILPLTLLAPSRSLVRSASIALAAALLALVQTDSLVFAESRFHLSALALRVLGIETWGFALASLAIYLVLCTLLARLLERRARPGPARWPALVTGTFAACLVVSQAVHVWADAHYYVPVTGFTPYLPLYRPVTAKHLLARWFGAIDLERTRDASRLGDLGEVQDAVLDYPKQPLRCSPPPAPLDVLVIAIDAMRADSANPRVAPNIARFGEQALRFGKHWSAGNGTRPGLFSLFYGLPPTYWNAFYAAQQPPVLIETFQKHGYRVGVFPSNPTDKLVGLDRTAFRSVPDLPDTHGDVNVTEGWLEFVAHRAPGERFFGFLFYESSPGTCPPDYPRPEDDPGLPGETERRRCYETAVHFADAQIGRVLADLEQRGLLASTLVVVTSDHGEEFDENGLGFKGHGSSYSRYQLHTPMLMRWPGRPTETIERRTSHHDVAPTLLSEVLGCSNDPSDYSSGRSMFSGEEWQWYVASSYTGLAVIEPDQTTISYGAYFEVRGPDYRLLDSPEIRSDVVAAAIRETGRFYRK
jgi:membrane-anchored protein YejM (alkaline phosphatase superfamily)